MIALGIVGGGASGLMAAITAGRLIKEQHMEDALSVTLLEAEESVGKKILATGNGRCNFTNRDFSMSKYHLEDENEKAFAEAVFRRFSVEDLCRFLIELGMGIRDRNGYLYPSTDQAGTVADLLIRELHRLPVKVCTGQTAAGLQVTDNGAFQVTTADHRVYSFHRLILATGTKAGLSPRQVKEREKDFLEPEAVAR
ncbi:MAG: NAD(P)/FAD-dependent oxidoreductase, partial [Lachnospiraceae bacterium]|nr:NAD(P)/FAD-dependent oxidoreductase [Lachnospiraceae bacterium]